MWKADVSNAASLLDMETTIRQDAMLAKPVRRRSIEDHEVLARFSHSLHIPDDSNDDNDDATPTTSKGQQVAAFIAAALETLEFYEAEISTMIETTAS